MRQINEVDQFSFDNLQHGLFIWDLVDVWLESFHVQNVWLESSNRGKQRGAVAHHHAAVPASNQTPSASVGGVFL